MNNFLSFAAGLGGGYALWRLTNSAPAPTSPALSARNATPSRPARRYALDGGRTILRDGQAIVRIERVDLGDARYVLPPTETDELGRRLVRLLNQAGGR